MFLQCIRPGAWTCDDLEAAKAVNRKTLIMYCSLPNYRNYWKEAGYVEEMEAIETALANKQRERIPELMSDRWLADCTLFAAFRFAGFGQVELDPSCENLHRWHADFRKRPSTGASES